MSKDARYGPLPLPNGVTEDYIDCTLSCGLNFHILQAGTPGKPLILFCHGYPELAFSWRHILPAVADAGYYCVAMDQRGYGRTTGWDDRPFHTVDLTQYAMTNLVRDLVCLTYRLGYTTAASIIGHDFGGVSSAMAALMRPDVFLSTIQLSHPHHAPPTPPLGRTAEPKPGAFATIDADLAKLSPPRKHYKLYNSTPAAAADWANPPQGLATFLRGYFHLKSGAWKVNAPRPLPEWSAAALEPMPTYYVMEREATMPRTVADAMVGEDETATRGWLSEEDLAVYVGEWERTGFQGALNWYRAQTAGDPALKREMWLFAGRRIEVPCAFVSGKMDWGNYQQPGALEGYEDAGTVREGCFRGMRLVEGAGHWVQQEKPQIVTEEILKFLKTL